MPDVGKVTGTVEMKDEFSNTFKKFGDGVGKTKIGLGSVAIAGAAVGAVLAKSVQAYNTQIQAVNALSNALANQGNLLPGTSKRLQEYASEIQKTTTFGDEQVIQAQATLASFGLQEDVIKRVTLASVNMSAATGIDLNKAMQLMGRSTAEGATVLRRYGIAVDSSLSKADQFEVALSELEKRFGGAAALQAETFAGKMTQVGNAAGDVMEKIGLFVEFLVNNFGGGIDNTITILEGLGNFFGQTLPIVVSEAQAVFAEAIGAILDGAATVVEFLNKIPGMSEVLPDPAILRAMAEGQADLATEIRADSEAFLEAASTGRDFNNVMAETADASGVATEANKEWEKQLQSWIQEAEEHAALLERQKAAAEEMADVAMAEITAQQDAETAERRAKAMEDSRDAMVASLPPLGQFVRGVTDNVEKQQQLVAGQKTFNEGMALAADLAQSLGGSFGSVISGITSAGSALKGLSVAGGGGLGGITKGIGATFSEGMKEAGGKGIMGLIGGMTNVIPMIGPMIGPAIKGVSALISTFFGGADIGEDVARDIGVGISQGLEDQIEQSGKNAQLFISEIFQEGFASGDPGATADMLATEIGDIFSGVQQGLFTGAEGMGAVEQAIPLLLEHFNELGEGGEEQIDRIVNAAREMGLEFEGLNDLISAQMGPSIQDVAEQFGLTVQEARGLSDILGVDLPTQIQVMAAQLGVAPKALRDVGAAMEEQLGIPAERIQELMETMGVSFEGLAESLGVAIPDAVGAGGTEAEQLAAGTAEVGENLSGAVAEANALSEALERAARASGNITIGNTGGPSPESFFAEGAVVTSPTIGMVGEKGAEVVAPVSALFGSLGTQIAQQVADVGGGGGGSTITIAPQLTIAEPLASAEAIQDVVLPPLIDAIKNDVRSIVGEITRKQERS